MVDMSATVQPSIALLRRAFQRTKQTALLSSALALGLVPMLFLPAAPGWARLGTGLLLGLYWIAKSARHQQAHLAIKQLRMEAQFVQHHLTSFHLYLCLHERNHLWRPSLVLQSLEAILDDPLPSLLPDAEKQRRLAERYRRAFASLQPARFNLDLGAWALTVAAAAFTLGAPPASFAGYLAAATALAVLIAEAYQSRLTWQLHAGFNRLYTRLATWTFTENFEQLILGHDVKPYTHTLLYAVRPWFTGQPDPKRLPPEPDDLTPAQPLRAAHLQEDRA